MRFAFTDDQLLFRDTVGELFAKECPPEAVRWSWNDDNGRNPELWATLAEMGVTGLTVPESHGGMGMNEVDLLPILTEAGRYAFPGPIVETIAVAAPLLAEFAPAAIAERWLPGIADGSVIATVALAGQPFVTDAHIADVLLTQRDDRIFAVPAENLRLTPQTSVDGARRLFVAEWDEADAELIASGDEGLRCADRAFNRGAAATAAVLIGLSEQMIAMTVASILLVGVTAGYSALARASQRLATSQAGLTDRPAPRCRPPEAGAVASTQKVKIRYRCSLPERCEYDTVSQSCRSTTSPSN